MICLAMTTLASLALFNYAVSRNLLYPPLLFTTTWLFSLAALTLSGDTFYPVAPDALLIYLAGAICFSAGGLFGLYCAGPDVGSRPSSAEETARARRALDIGLLFCLVGLPFFLRQIVETVPAVDYSMLASLRVMSVETSESSERSFSLVNNLVLLAAFVAMAMHYENDGTPSRRWRSYVAILTATFYGILTGSKGWILIFPTLAFITYIGRKTVRFAALFAVLGLTVVFFSVGLLMINFFYSELGSPAEMAAVLARHVQNYWLGSLVAFNRVVENPDSIAPVQSLGRFFLETANALGASYRIPSIHADYTQVSSLDDTNTYTIYFSYFRDLGWFGVVAGMTLLGGLLSAIFRYALGRRKLAVFVFGTAAVGIVLSLHAEHFVLALNYYIKLVLVFYLVYHVFSRKISWTPG